MSGEAPVVCLQTTDPREAASWEGLADLAALMSTGWSLAGGSLVRLLAAERGSPHSRSTRDIDLILDVRAHPGSVQRVVRALQEAGFTPATGNPSGKDYRWVREDAQIDVLTPDFLGPRWLDRKFPGLGYLFPTRGAQFGLHRTECAPVTVNGRTFTVNRPDLIGALYEKCSALLVPMDADKSRHHHDIALLVSFVGPGERRTMLTLGRRQRRRLVQGMTSAAESARVDRRDQEALRRLVALLVQGGA